MTTEFCRSYFANQICEMPVSCPSPSRSAVGWKTMPLPLVVGCGFVLGPSPIVLIGGRPVRDAPDDAVVALVQVHLHGAGQVREAVERRRRLEDDRCPRASAMLGRTLSPVDEKVTWRISPVPTFFRKIWRCVAAPPMLPLKAPRGVEGDPLAVLEEPLRDVLAELVRAKLRLVAGAAHRPGGACRRRWRAGAESRGSGLSGSPTPLLVSWRRYLA